MKRKVIIIALSLFVSLSLLSAKDDFVIGPYKGFSGISVGSNAYKGGHWVQNSEKYDSSDAVKDPSVGFTDEEMLSLLSIKNISGSDASYPITISAYCPNDFYLTSISNPAIKRPFEIWIIPNSNRGDLNWNWNQYKPAGEEAYVGKYVSSLNPTVDFFLKESDTSVSTYAIWFDVVLVLPGTVDYENNRLVVIENGVEVYYPLVEADDYTSLVYLTISFKDKSETIYIPFSGYYKSEGNQRKANSTVALDVITYPEAASINIPRRRGQWISLGEIHYLLEGNINSCIFLSSSANCYDSSANTFSFVNENVDYSTALTSSNSIGYEARIINLDTRELLSFDGTTFFDLTLGSLSSNSDELKSKYIIPTKKTVGGTSGSNTFPGTTKDVSYSSYQGEIQIRLDNTDTTMISGRYESEIYIHVITEE